MARSGLFVGLVFLMWLGCFCNVVESATVSNSFSLQDAEIPEMNDSTVGLQADHPGFLSGVYHTFLESAASPTAAAPSFATPPAPAVEQPSYQWPPATPDSVGQPSYESLLAAQDLDGSPDFTPAVVSIPSFQLPPATPVAVSGLAYHPHAAPAAVSSPFIQLPAATAVEEGEPLSYMPVGIQMPTSAAVTEPVRYMPAGPGAVSGPSLQMPAATPDTVGEPVHYMPASPVSVSIPSFQMPTATPVAVSEPVYHIPATPAAVSSPSFQMPAGAAVDRPSYHMAAATPVTVSIPAFQLPDVTPAVVGHVSPHVPVATPIAVGKPEYQKPAATPAPMGKPSVKPIMPIPDIVIAECGESSLRVAVDTTLLGNGQLVDPSDVTLGGCGPVWQDKSQWMHFETELHGCGSTHMMTEESLIYTFTLNYQPKAFPGTPIQRSSAAVVTIQCHYPRQHNVSSNALNPTWIPYQAAMASEQLLQFTLRLMADDWQHERSSNVYFLGDLLNIEASVIQAYHVPLRIYIESCVAYLDPSLVPSYAFIDKDGCLMDSQQPGSRSSFLPRVQDNIIQLQLDVFRFAQDDRNMIYMYCNLKATAASNPHGGKACSFLPEAGQWFSLSGLDTCGCCDSTCGPTRKGRSLDDSVWEGKVFLGPITVQQSAGRDLASLTQSGVTERGGPEGTGVSLAAAVVAGLLAVVGVISVIALVAVRRSTPKSVHRVRIINS